ncbi:transcriptional Coactivator p15-domain-containing protein [Phaeosphaeria sp. MPI-PUGE-AT-0046c]|nr:transcriptional Coactivator p15-domain-containing protein [Phaeosphaeria sp. MPI-PUGE-AT-0046c]
MAGFKRGGFRGGGGGAFKKGISKKRAGSDDEDSTPRASKKTKSDEEEDATPFVPVLKTDGDKQHYVGLNASGKRRVTVRDFKDNVLIDIREHWTDDSGDLKPGRKGISLNLEQYNTLIAALPLLEVALAEKKAQAARPDYEVDLSAAKATKDADAAEGDKVEKARGDADDDEEVE